ncbi:hypothetical protein PPYR_10268 [Photinus pyralis]|uniref:EF-hand domain-containing protein n=1 Tax=Photinus pyralis TaxID=7054 RepID=A0A5N4AFV3_PHOPY|nr:uncharacterized protein LOC116174156 [Photinus pyralis]KAB0796207.1 hypothetical protein PPYR_10268 [Photinus pyralis]
MPPIEKPPNGSRKSAQELLRLNNQVRRNLDNRNSLSTITEEPKSFRTMTSSDTRAVYSDESLSDEFVESLAQESIRSAPMLREPPAPRKKRHTSVVVKGATPQVAIPHEDTWQRTPAMKKELLDHIGSAGKPLFETITGDISSEPMPSILVTGFGIRNLASLQTALQLDEEERQLRQVYRTDAELQPETHTPSLKSTTSSKSVEVTVHGSESTSETQTESSVSVEWKEGRLNYLMGLDAEAIEEEQQEAYRVQKEGVRRTVTEVAMEQEAPVGKSVLMRRAQRYLREHKIFEFFQFIVAHLLSALPENPVEFIIDLMDQCMMFRSGLTKPPLLYDKKHLDCLFNLMDKMRTGHIEVDQYRTGMRTVGVCSFNQNPPLTPDGMVAKNIFIDEAYECLTELLSDLLKRRWIDTPPPLRSFNYVPTPQLSIISSVEQTLGPPFQKTRCILR